MNFVKTPIYLKQASVFPHYQETYQESIEQPQEFWSQIAESFLWEKKWAQVFDEAHPERGWFVDGKLNITINALDRHVVGAKRNKVALFWTAENGREVAITYDRLQKRVCQVANALKNIGVQKGDAVLIYMPNTVETVYAMLACARIGAIHVMLHVGLGNRYIRDYIQTIKPKCVFVSDVMYHKGVSFNLKQIMDKALSEVYYEGYRIVLRRENSKMELRIQKELDFHDFMNHESKWINPEIVQASDPLFMLFTSQPNATMDGFAHTHGGYMVGAGYYTKIINDLQESDISWSTSDISSIEGHTNGIYGPLLNGSTIYFREGSLAYPSPDAAWRAIDKHGINILSTTPDVLYELKSLDTKAPEEFDHSTLRLVSVLSDMVHTDLYLWIKENLAGINGAVIDTWFNAELGAPLIGTVLALDKKLQSTGKPYPGVHVQIVDEHGQELTPNQQGYLSLKYPIPSMNQTMCGFKKRHHKIPQDAIDVKASIDLDGYITVKDWHKDALLVGDHWVSVEEIEAFLMHIPIVKQVKVWLCNYVENENNSISISATIKNPLGDHSNLIDQLKSTICQEFGCCVAENIAEIRTQ